MNDADLSMQEMTTRANLGAAARRQGRCPHYSLQRLTCPDCGQTMADDRSWAFAMQCAEERECWGCGDDAVTRDGRCSSCEPGTVKAPRYFGF